MKLTSIPLPHISDRGRTKAGDVFGPRKASANLERPVWTFTAYGETRHTTTTELTRIVGTDGARKASSHTTNKAFDRYCQVQDKADFEMAKVIEEKRGKNARGDPLKTG